MLESMIFSIIFIFCVGESMGKDYGIYPRDKGRLTVKGRVCQFPFSYQGVVYTDCAPGLSQSFHWCATTTKDDFSNTMMDWEICASVTRVDDKICKSLDYDNCKSEAIKKRCPQMCSAGVDDKICKSLDYDDCKSEAIKKRCPQMCSADFCIVAGGTKVAGQCLFFSDDSKTRADSIKFCEAKGQQLASLLDPIDFNAYMKSNYGPFEAFWLGGSDWKNEGRWVWIDGRPFDNFPWKLGQPDDNQDYGGQDCLA